MDFEKLITTNPTWDFFTETFDLLSAGQFENLVFRPQSQGGQICVSWAHPLGPGLGPPTWADTAGMLLFSCVPILQLLNRSAENHKHLSTSRIWVPCIDFAVNLNCYWSLKFFTFFRRMTTNGSWLEQVSRVPRLIQQNRRAWAAGQGNGGKQQNISPQCTH